MSFKHNAFSDHVPVRYRRCRSGLNHSLFLLLAFGFAASPAFADVRLLSLDGGLSGFATAGPPVGVLESCPVFPFTHRRFSAENLSDSDANNCSVVTVQAQAESTKEVAYTVTVAEGLVTGFTASAVGEASSSLLPTIIGGTAVAQGAGETIINVQVERAVIASVLFDVTATGNGSTAQVIVSSPLDCSGNGCDFLSQACSNTATSGSRCFPSTSNEVRELPATIRLEPGIYRFAIFARTGVASTIQRGDAQSGSASASLGVTFVPAEEIPCELSWATPTSGGFADSANWEPQAAPDACANLTLNQAGAYTVAVNPGITANSLSALGGEPSILGGSLSLVGGDLADALRIDGAARLSLGGGTLSANGAVVGLNPVGGASPSFMRIEPGASLEVVGGLDLGREAGSFGELTLGGGASNASITASGGTNIGVFGRGRLLGEGALELNLPDGMTLGVFTGSEALVELTGVFDDIRSVNMTVGQTLTIGDGGNGVLALSTLAILETDRIALGASSGGDGTLTTSGANCAVNVSTAIDVGVAGKGEMIILDASAVRAPDVALGKGATGLGTVTIEGQDSRLAVSAGITVGERGASTLTAAAGGIIEAGSLTVGNGTGVAGTLNLDGSVTGVRLTVADAMTLGSFGDASLRGDGSTQIDVGGSLSMGVFPDSTAFVLIAADEGEDAFKISKLTVANDLTLGAAGSAFAEFNGLSLVEAGGMRLGLLAGGRGVFSVSGGLNVTTVAGLFSVGGGGKGEVAAKDGAVIRAGASIVGEEPGGLGELRLQSGASLLVENIPPAKDIEAKTEGEAATPVSFGFLEIGKGGNGLIELFDAGTGATCENAVLGGDNPGAGGTLSVDTGARFTASGNLAMGTNNGPALVRVASGGSVDVAAFLLIGPKGLFVVGPEAQMNCANLTLTGRVRIVENLIIERPPTLEKGEVSPPVVKAASGPAVINGNLKMEAGGVLEVAALGSKALQITGEATLAGTLEIVLLPGVSYADGQLVDLIDFSGGIVGSFEKTTVTNAPADFAGTLETGGGVARLRVVNGGIGLGGNEGAVEGAQEVLAPTIISLSPTTGSTAGGEWVTLTGTNLSDATAVLFGDEPGTALDATSATEVRVKTPAHEAGLVAVIVQSPGGATTRTDAYTFVAPGADGAEEGSEEGAAEESGCGAGGTSKPRETDLLTVALAALALLGGARKRCHVGNSEGHILCPVRRRR